MSMAELLEPFGGGLSCDDPEMNVFDIHGGGIDLVFPHHENEVAQTCCALGTPQMARVWMHNGFLQVEGQKMSKSLGNFVTIRELLETDAFGGRSWPGDVLRLAMLRTHYRQPIDWTVRALEDAEQTLDEWYGLATGGAASGELDPRLLSALENDLNTPEAVSVLHAMAGEAKAREGPARPDGVGRLVASAQLLGLMQSSAQAWFAARAPAVSPDELQAIEALLATRAAARAARNWAESDRLRDELAGIGVVVKDSKEGTTWEFSR
jgi:cysteinyl-tRNA synthetase